VLLAIVFHPELAFAATKVATDADKGGIVHLKVGDQLELRLQSNPSTGFMWRVHAKSTRLLKLTSQSQTKPTEPGVGRPIFQVFNFQSRQSGAGDLLLHYVRSWEKPSADERQFNLHVIVE
jgi:inhibitor of cysteine peptidase